MQSSEKLKKMTKYTDSAVVFQEIPDEITLAIEISNCPHKCKHCHSPRLRKNIGKELTNEELDRLIEAHPGITCVCFMGGDADHKEISFLAIHLKQKYPDIKRAMYSGDEEIDQNLVFILDYYKVGPYIEQFGPLNKATTNQKLYKIKNLSLIDITFKFWPKAK